MFNKIAVGGTFDRLHGGHRALLSKAFEVGRSVVIGLTSDEMLEKEADGLAVRKRLLEDYLKGKGRYKLTVLGDPYGPAIEDPEMDAIVVSEETRPRVMEINGIRRSRGLAPLEIITIPMVLAADGRPISSSRIRRGDIDGEGRILKRR